MISILNRLTCIADNLPENQPALTDGISSLSYKTLVERIEQVSRWLQKSGIQSLALYGDNSIDWVVTDLACQQANVVCIPLPTFFSVKQIRRCLEAGGIRTVLNQPDSKFQRVDLPIQAQISLADIGIASGFELLTLSAKKTAELPDKTRKVTFTSGSTGAPKGVCLSTNQQWRVAESLANTIGINQPRHLCLLPLSTLLENIAGIYTPLLSGGTILLPGDAERGMSGSSSINVSALLQCIDKTSPTTMILIPQLLTALTAACQQGWQPPASLQFVAVGGGRVSPESIRLARQYGLPVFQGYGLSECGSVVALNTADRNSNDAVGAALPHCSVTIENSEIVVSGASHLGYLGEPDSWYPDKVYTGDKGEFVNGLLHVNGRLKNLLITSFGRNVSPEWVESELMSQPLLSHCMIVGDARPYLTALISAPAQIADATIEAWVQHTNEKLPDYAKVACWIRVNGGQLQPYTTANGRLKRQCVENKFSALLDECYEQAPLLSQQNQ
ncbi:MAG: AMP-binding protein [Porticoccaceae bacterium]|nr:AMP-binding protein [Pseudomonadales bacterium]MCP5302195.1 AMP-binding protein [Pseudomonadales bacterium]